MAEKKLYGAARTSTSGSQEKLVITKSGDEYAAVFVHSLIGGEQWLSRPTLQELIDSLVVDDGFQIFEFASVREFGAWLSA